MQHERILLAGGQTRQAAGHYALRWDGQSNGGVPVGAGVYFAKLTVDTSILVKKLTVLR